MRLKNIFFVFFLICAVVLAVCAQAETLTDADIIELTKAGLGVDLIVAKINSTNSRFDISAKSLVELKQAQVENEVIAAMLEKAKGQPEISAPKAVETSAAAERKSLTPAEMLRSARTVAIHKTSLYPSPKALERELMKRSDWQKLDLSITEERANADLEIDISFVHFSIITHRYLYSVFDRRSGFVIAAGETTSWGSLPANLARHISVQLEKIATK